MLAIEIDHDEMKAGQRSGNSGILLEGKRRVNKSMRNRESIERANDHGSKL